MSTPLNPPTWSDRFADWRDRLSPDAVLETLRGPGPKGVLLSTLLHVALLFAMAAYTFEVLTEADGTATAFEEGDELLDGEIDTSLVDFAAGAASLEAAAPEVTFEPLADLDATALPTADSLALPTLGQGFGEGAALGDGPGAGGELSDLPFARPREGKTITKGSFTAWTVPEDPEPKQNYVIVIEIRVPRQIRRYPRADLSGVVVGTDQYRQKLPGRGDRFVPKRDGVAQIAIPVPGAKELVQDTIIIRSRILKEEQTLTLTF